MIGLRVRFLNINITIFNLLMRLDFSMVGLILNCVTYFSTKGTYISLEV